MSKKRKLRCKHSGSKKHETYRCTMMKYTFYHGRLGLVYLYGFASGIFFMFLITSFVFSIPFLYAFFGYSHVFAMVVLMLPLISPPLYLLFWPPDWTGINVRCTGILHSESIEIHKGNRVRTQRYIDIKRVFKFRHRGGTTWRFGKVSISNPIGLQKKYEICDLKLDSFLMALEQRVKRARNER